MLQKATVELLDQALCGSLYGHSLTDRMVCAGYLGGKVDSCQVSPAGRAAGRAPGFPPRGHPLPQQKGRPPFLVHVQDVPHSMALDFFPFSLHALLFVTPGVGGGRGATAARAQGPPSRPPLGTLAVSGREKAREPESESQ